MRGYNVCSASYLMRNCVLWLTNFKGIGVRTVFPTFGFHLIITRANKRTKIKISLDKNTSSPSHSPLLKTERG